jgi:muramidase (phage lysozyme)
MNEIESTNLVAFLKLIRACEGTDAPNGYRYLFGSTYSHEVLFDDYSKHPNIRKSFTQHDGTIGYSTAAGAYQIINATWNRIAVKLTLLDFGPQNQDTAAIELIRERGQLANVMEGTVRTAIDVLWVEWASLPSSRYGQPRRSMDFAMNAFESAGGVSV